MEENRLEEENLSPDPVNNQEESKHEEEESISAEPENADTETVTAVKPVYDGHTWDAKKVAVVQKVVVISRVFL
jgi:hypothetical protein